MSEPKEEPPITFEGWWSEDEKADSPEPWETFTVMVHGQEAGDMRNAAVEDLRLAGFVPATEPRFTLEEILPIVRSVYHRYLNYDKIATANMAIRDEVSRLQESRR